VLVQRSIGPHLVEVECSPANAELAEPVLDKLEELHRTGPPLHAGTKIQFGWSVLMLQPHGPALSVCEPAFFGNISTWKPSVDVTLDVLREQVGLLRTVSEAGVDARFDHVVLMTRGALDEPDLFLKREAPRTPDDTGWFVGRLDDLETARQPDALDSVRVFEILRRRRDLMAPLALPPEYLAIVRGRRLEALLDRNLRLRLGSYPVQE
jgi:hypothetical protein